MKTALPLCCLALAIAGPVQVYAQAAQERAPEEVIVEAPKSLRQLRLAVNRAEKRMFETFNVANTDDRFDIQCRMEPIRGSKMRQQVCQPGYRAEANEAEAKMFLKASNPEVAGVQVNGPGFTSLDHYNGRLGDKIREAAANSPEFRDALQQYNALSAIYSERTSAD